MGPVSEEQVSGGEPPSDLRPLNASDVDAIKEIAAVSFPTQWKAEDYRFFLNDSASYCWGIFGPRGELRAYLLALRAADELDIVSIATRPEFRKQGLALRLLRECFARENWRLAALEVDVGNAAAIALYKRLGFRITKRRVRYYEGKRDAYQMLLEMREGIS